MAPDRSVVDAPDWFLRNCVKTTPEINRLAAQISLRRKPSSKGDAAKDSPLSAESRKEKDGPAGKGARKCYQVESCIYDDLLGLVATKEKEDDAVSFIDDAILVRLPDSEYPGCDFLVSMAAKFASDVDADMIVLNYDDLHDLAEYFYFRQESELPVGNTTFLQAFLKPEPKNKPKKPTDKPKSPPVSNPGLDPVDDLGIEPIPPPEFGADPLLDSDPESTFSSSSGSESEPDSGSDSDSSAQSVISLDSTSRPPRPISEPQPRPQPTTGPTYLLNSRTDKMMSALSGQALSRIKGRPGRLRYALTSLPRLVSSTFSGLITIPMIFPFFTGLKRPDTKAGDQSREPTNPPPVKDKIKENAAVFFRSVLSSPLARAALDEKERKESEEKERTQKKNEVEEKVEEKIEEKVEQNAEEKAKKEKDKTENEEDKKDDKKDDKKSEEKKSEEEKSEEEKSEEKKSEEKKSEEKKSEDKKNEGEGKDDKGEKPLVKQTKPRGHFNAQNPKAKNVRPIVIVIPQLEKFGRLTNWAFRGLKALKASSPHLKKSLITITTTSRSDKPPNSAGRRPLNPFPETPIQPEPPRISMFVMRHFGPRPNMYEFLAFPTRSPAQVTSFSEDKDQISQRHSIRILQRELRREMDYRDVSHLQPYAEWDIPDSDSNPVTKYLRGGKLQSTEECLKVGGLLVKSRKAAKLQDILRFLTQASEGSDALSKWNERDAKGGSSADLPPRVVRVIKRVTEDAERSCSEFNAELEIMKTLVHPSELSQGWSDIEVEPAIKSRVQRMISLLNRRSELTGILKKSAMGGVILYGPPGTGKTHLARVIAKETSSVMLRISAAEIERTWAGEAEKVIQALFKLAREIYPCIVFIDEADSIFGRRRDSDKNWERKITNQLLGEFGGFENDIASPLLLLATNFPNDLDPAVLRRAPNRLYMGLPSTPSRQNIFKICLREEKMDKSVNLEELAEKTSGYTGSDIEYICQQAAMAALEDFESGDDSEKNGSEGICLKMEHFSQTLTGASPSVSGPSMTGIETFAREYDRSAVDRIKKTTDDFSGFSSYLYI